MYFKKEGADFNDIRTKMREFMANGTLLMETEIRGESGTLINLFVGCDSKSTIIVVTGPCMGVEHDYSTVIATGILADIVEERLKQI